MYSYKGAITFGLVYIPVELVACIKNNDIGFNLIDKKTMSRVKYKKTCVDCDDREVKNEDIVKGYQYEKDKYVIFTDKDFEKIKTKKDKNITIEQFVDLTEVDPVYFDKAYYVKPTGGEKAFTVLLSAMEKENKAGIAKVVLGTKEALVLIRGKDGVMLVNTLYFYDINTISFTLYNTLNIAITMITYIIPIVKILLNNLLIFISIQTFKQNAII